MRSIRLIALVGMCLVTTGIAAGQQTAANQPVHLKLIVPADAQVWLNDVGTTTQGPVREFLSPSVKPGQSYIYTIRVRWQRYGQTIDQKRDIAVNAGDFVLVNFEGSAGGYGPTPVITYGDRSYYAPSRPQMPVYFSSRDDEHPWNRIGYYYRQTGILSYYGATPGWGTVDTTGLR
jgi:uncharacterized protein (TIGR03000 family)